MTPVIYRYPFDKTGKSLNNLVQDEYRTMERKPQRVLVPLYGAFFVDSLKVIDTHGQQLLDEGVHYTVNLIDPEAIKVTGQEVCHLIVITDSTVGDEVVLTYQAVGAKYMSSMPAVYALAQQNSNDDRSLLYSSIADVPSYFTPVAHFHSMGDVYAMDPLAHSTNMMRLGVMLADTVSHDAFYRQIDSSIAMTSDNNQDDVDNIMATHEADPLAHPQYALLSEVNSLIKPIRQPVNASPVNGATNVVLDVTMGAGPFYSLYRVSMAAARWQISKLIDFSDVLLLDATVTGTQISYHYGSILASNTNYYWRVSFQDTDGNWSDFSNPTLFTTAAVSVSQPTISSPTGGNPSNAEGPTITASAFQIVGAVDTQSSSDWEVWSGPNGTGTLVWSSTADTVNLTSITMPKGVLTRGSTYYPRVRYNAVKYGKSPFSTGASFLATWELRPTTLGQAWGGGFWAGDIIDSGQIYAIIVAPKASGEVIAPMMAHTVVGPKSRSDGKGNQALLNSLGAQPATWAASLTIGGFTDWMVPPADALEVMYRNLKQSASVNDTTSGANNSTSPVSNKYSATVPAQTLVTNFMNGGQDCFENKVYWSSTTNYNTSTVTTTSPSTPIYGSGFVSSQVTRGTYPVGGSPALPTPTCASPLYVNGTLYSENAPNQGFIAWQYIWDCYTPNPPITGYKPGTTTTTTQQNFVAFTQSMVNGLQAQTDYSINCSVRAIRMIPFATAAS